MKTILSCLNWAKHQWSWLKWPVAVALLAFLYFHNQDQFHDLANRQISWGYFALAFVLCFGSILLTFLRWYLLVSAQGFPFRISDAMRLGFIGYMFNFIGPGSAGGDIVKAVLIAREQKERRAIAAATVLLDRVLGLWALFMVGAFASLFQPPEILEHKAVQILLSVLWGGFIAGLIGITVVLHPAVPRSKWIKRLVNVRVIGGIIGGLMNALLLYQQKRRYLVIAVAISIVGHFGILTCFYLCAQGLQLQESAPGFWAHLLFIPGAELAGVFIPTPGGIGALEGAVQFSYSIANQALTFSTDIKTVDAAGLFAAIGFRLITIVVAAIGVGYYLTARREISAALEETDKTAAVQSEIDSASN